MKFDKYKVADLLTRCRLQEAHDYANSHGEDFIAISIGELMFSHDQDYPSLIEDIIHYDLGIKN